MLTVVVVAVCGGSSNGNKVIYVIIDMVTFIIFNNL